MKYGLLKMLVMTIFYKQRPHEIKGKTETQEQKIHRVVSMSIVGFAFHEIFTVI